MPAISGRGWGGDGPSFLGVNVGKTCTSPLSVEGSGTRPPSPVDSETGPHPLKWDGGRDKLAPSGVDKNEKGVGPPLSDVGEECGSGAAKAHTWPGEVVVGSERLLCVREVDKSPPPSRPPHLNAVDGAAYSTPCGSWEAAVHSPAAWQGHGSLSANASVFTPNAGTTIFIGPSRCEMGVARGEPLGPSGWSHTIKLKVREESGNIFTCELDKSARFAKIFNAYAQERGLQASTLKFSFQGKKNSFLRHPGTTANARKS